MTMKKNLRTFHQSKICFLWGIFLFTMFTLAHGQTPEKKVVFKTREIPGGVITFGASANGDVAVEGVTGGVWQNGKDVSYFVGETQTITLKGDITSLYLDNTKIESIDVSHAPSLYSLSIKDNFLKELDVSNNIQLEYVYAQNNQLEDFVVCSGGKVARVYCIDNKIKAEKMRTLIESLPDRTPESYPGILGVIDLSLGAPEGNICTKALVKLAQSKNWSIKFYDGLNYLAYEGSEGGDLPIEKDEIELKTLLKVGETFPMSLLGEGDIEFLGLEISESLQSGNIYKITSQDISIKGTVKSIKVDNCKLITLATRNSKALEEVYCKNNPLKRLNLTENKKLKNLNCANTEIENLDLSGNPDLEELDCSNNRIKKLDFANNQKIYRIYCDNNLLQGDGVEVLCLNLVNRADEESKGELVVANLNNSEQNIFYKRQIQSLKAKGWLVRARQGEKLVNYEGKEEPYIVLTTERKVGEKVELRIKSVNNVNIDGLSGSWVNDKPVEYVIEKQTFTISGEIETLYCYGNELTAIDCSHADFLHTIDCSNNLLKGERMDQVMNLLPTRSGPIFGKITVIDTRLETENNVCTKKQSFEARQKGWQTMQNVKGKGNIPYAGYSEEEPIVITSNTIKFRTEKPVNSTIYLMIQSRQPNPDIKFVGIRGDFINNAFVKYVVENQEFSIQGDIYRIDCIDNGLTELDLSDCHSLESIYCGRNKLKSLKLNNLRSLIEVLCFENQITTLDLSGNPRFEYLNCTNNFIKEDGFQNIINTICNRQYDEVAGEIIFSNRSQEGLSENNIASKAQVEEIKKKNWLMKKVIGMEGGLLQFDDYLHKEEVFTSSSWYLSYDSLRKILTINNTLGGEVICLFDMNGRLVYSQYADSEGTTNLDLQHLSAGQYIVKVGEKAQVIIL